MEELTKNNNIEKLQEELAIRGKYYFKGFGAYLQGLLADIRDISNLVEIERTPDREQHTRDMINKINSLYKSIPFEQITNHPDCDLLLQIKEAISRLVPKVEAILAGGSEVDEVYEIIGVISDKGMEYRARLKAILNKIREQPGHEKEMFEITDIKGNVWKNFSF